MHLPSLTKIQVKKKLHQEQHLIQLTLILNRVPPGELSVLRFPLWPLGNESGL